MYYVLHFVSSYSLCFPWIVTSKPSFLFLHVQNILDFLQLIKGSYSVSCFVDMFSKVYILILQKLKIYIILTLINRLHQLHKVEQTMHKTLENLIFFLFSYFDICWCVYFLCIFTNSILLRFPISWLDIHAYRNLRCFVLGNSLRIFLKKIMGKKLIKN